MSGDREQSTYELSACVHATTKTDDVSIRIFDVEVLCPPCGISERLDDHDAISQTPLMERLEAIDTRCCIEMIVVTSMLAHRRVVEDSFEKANAQ